MKKIFIIISTIVYSFSLTAQISAPEFEMPFYLQDAKGNKDTVVLGYDKKYSTLSELKPWWGEKNILTPFDSIFEVRIYRSDSDGFYLGKKSIGWYEKSSTLTCGGTQHGIIIIQAKYPPVTIQFDSDLFQKKSCRELSFICPDFSGMNFRPNPWESKELQLLSKSNIYTTDFSSFYNKEVSWWHKEWLVEGGKTKRDLPGLAVIFHGLTYGVSTKDNPDLFDMSVFPNPTADVLNIDTQPDLKGNAFISNLLGQVLVTQAINENGKTNFDIAYLPKGIYVVTLKTVNGSNSMKIVKE
jgi:hypothetical protein